MNLKESRLAWLVAILAVVALFAAACSDGDEAASGEIFITGSSTVEPISVSVAEVYADENPEVEVTVEGPGTGDGFEAFCNGEADITDASRPIDAEEVAACDENGIEFIELKVGIDGISVLTNPANEDVTCLNFADLYALVGPEAEGISSWSDAQPLATELGSATELPDLALDVTAPGEESGTYDSFIELALGDIAEAQLEAGAITEEQAETTRPDYSSQADDNAIITGIEGSDGSLGWVGFAFAEEAGDGVQELEIAEGNTEDCVAPSAESIQDGSYPLARDLYIYVSATAVEENPAVVPFVDFYVADLVTDVEGVGYVALDDESQATTQQTWEDRTTGTVDGGE